MKNIKSLLQEIYEIDPNLKSKEKELEKIISHLYKATPAVEINHDFKDTLKAQILEKVQSNKLSQHLKERKQTNIWKSLSIVFGSMGIAAFGMFFWQDVYSPNTQTHMPLPISQIEPEIIAFQDTITPTTKNFGNLANLGGEDASDMYRENFTKSMSLKMGVSQDMAILPYPGDGDYKYDLYRYNFSGEEIEIPREMQIYKKSPNTQNMGKILAKSFSNLEFNGLNLDNFPNLSVGYITFNQDQKYGYSLNFDVENSEISLYKNWNKWPEKQYIYDEKSSKVEYKTKEFIDIANKFLSQNNIDTSIYGEPVILEENRFYTMRDSTFSIAPYYNSEVTIVYPYLIDGKEIYYEYGGISGLNIGIDIASKKVSSLYGLKIQNFESSTYEIENNFENILEVANVGGRYGFYDYDESQVNIIQKDIENPQLIYIENYEYKDGSSTLYYIPAIRFDIVKDENDEYYYENFITVPLVKDFYTYDENGKITGVNER